VEAVFRPEIFRIFSNGFLPESTGIHWKKSEKFLAGS
jgi:hypothetical protein